MSITNRIKADMQKLADPQKAAVLSRFFKTGKGEYGEGDKFLGITVPQQRLVARRYGEASFADLRKLLASRVHEHRLVALLILTAKFRKANDIQRGKIVDFYLGHTRSINNWDLVDLSTEKILGEYLYERDKSVLYHLAVSRSLWERRMAIMATFAFIKRHAYQDALRISEILLYDDHDLIHKAVGWMLREIGKRDVKAEEAFLRRHSADMPRTMLRYAVERFPEERRRYWLKK